PPVVAATTDTSSGPQTWRAEVTPAQLDGLQDGTLTASAVYTLGSGTVSGVARTFAKDTVAPDAPQATPGSGVYSTSQSVALHTTHSAATVHLPARRAPPPRPGGKEPLPRRGRHGERREPRRTGTAQHHELADGERDRGR